MLRENLQTTLEAAIAAGDECKEHTLRLILSAIRDQDIAAREAGQEDGLSDDQISKMLKTMIAQRQAAIQEHEASGKIDLVDWENREIAVIEDFMPRACENSEAEAVCREVIEDLGATGIKDIGKTIEGLRSRLGDRFDFCTAKSIARSLLI